MCLIAFALNQRDDVPLLIASNRDEYWHRPTQPLGAWMLPSGATIYSGRDAEAGGTWLGFAACGRVAMLTNVRPTPSDSAVHQPVSRGALVADWLAGASHHRAWQDLVAAHAAERFQGFNLVLGDVQGGDWVWLTNRRPNDKPLETPLPPGWYGSRLSAGVYGLSNAQLDTPWAKTLMLRQAVTDTLTRPELADDASDGWQRTLLEGLMSRRKDDRLAAPLHHRAAAASREWQLSSAFVHEPSAAYGTRSSLLGRYHRAAHGGWTLDLHEWTHLPVHRQPSADEKHWPLEGSDYRRLSIQRWGMPTSSNGSPSTA